MVISGINIRPMLEEEVSDGLILRKDCAHEESLAPLDPCIRIGTQNQSVLYSLIIYFKYEIMKKPSPI